MINKYDFFISYASEDRNSFVEKLYTSLTENSLKVWYDDKSLLIGDNLKNAINTGLSDSRYGIVIISENWLNKIGDKEKGQWLISELKDLSLKEKRGEKAIIPVWYGIDESILQIHNLSLELVKEMQDRFAGRFCEIKDIENKEVWDKFINKFCDLSSKIRVQARLPQSRKIKDPIAVGSLTDVFEISNESVGRDEAIKILFRQEVKEKFIKSFKASIRVSEQPNFITIYDANIHDEPYYYIMQYIKGDTLRKYISDKSLALKGSREILITLIRSFIQVQKLHLEYESVKPSNIIIIKTIYDDKADEYEPFISPFSFLESYSNDEIKIELLQSLKNLNVLNRHEKKEYLEILAYLPPEKFSEEASTFSAKSLQYTLGILAYELITKKFPPNLKEPFRQLEDLNDEENDGEFKKAVEKIIRGITEGGDKIFTELKSDNSPIINENPHCSKFFEDIVLKMISINPYERHASLQEIIKLIEYSDSALDIVKESYTRCLRNDKFNEDFLESFYNELEKTLAVSYAKIGRLVKKYEKERQYKQLNQIIFMLFSYYEQSKLLGKDNISEQNVLTNILEAYSVDYKIRGNLYEVFGKCLVKTVIVYDTFCEEEKDKPEEKQNYTHQVKKAWEAVIEPTVKYLTSECNTGNYTSRKGVYFLSRIWEVIVLSIIILSLILEFIGIEIPYMPL